MKLHARVIGHELVQKAEVTFVKIKLKGTELGNLKIEFLVDEGERARYPFGAACTVDFGVQQTMALEH
jgi:hypothetical protein